MLNRVCLLTLIFASHAALTLATDPNGPHSPSSTTLGQFVSPLVHSNLKIDGAASCAATACHGGPRASVANAFALRGSEYPLWLEQDPHASSWRTICGEKSRAILKRLNIIQDDGEILNQPAFDNCLACHNSTSQFKDLKRSEMLREGVGCNSCHGPSERWKATHYQSTWQSQENIQNGFVPATQVLARARMCASCHIGDQDRDMNHDIIAAGHPALFYEFTSYHQRLPKHWRDSESSDIMRYESSQWMAGQVAALDASLTLLEARASKTLPTSQWPDFASYECASCHQQLRPGSLDYTIRNDRGIARLSRWNQFGVVALLGYRKSKGSLNPSEQSLEDALLELDRVSHLSPDISANQLILASKTVREQMDRWLNSRERSEEKVRFQVERMSARQLRDVLTQAGAKTQTFANWESAAQFYLGSVAARAAWPDGLHGESLSTARELRSVLMFKPGSSLQPSDLWQSTTGFKSVPIQAGIQHWNAISSTPVH